MNGVCDTWCEGCEFLAKSADVYCDYNSIVGHSRPCRAGKDCTERVRPENYRRDPRLESLEKATLEAMKAEKKKQKKPKRERCGRPSQYGGVSMTPEYAAAQRARHRAQILREGRLAEEAKAIRAWREARGLTQKQLGALVGPAAAPSGAGRRESAGANGPSWKSWEL